MREPWGHHSILFQTDAETSLLAKADTFTLAHSLYSRIRKDDQTADGLARALLDDTGAPTLADPHELLRAHLRPHLLPDWLRSPEALGVLRYGMVTYGDPTAISA